MLPFESIRNEDKMIEHRRLNDIGGSKREWLLAKHYFALGPHATGEGAAIRGERHLRIAARDDAELVMVVTRHAPQP
jgi:hypothetical protein